MRIPKPAPTLPSQQVASGVARECIRCTHRVQGYDRENPSIGPKPFRDCAPHVAKSPTGWEKFL
jgi:hypothetical protein